MLKFVRTEWEENGDLFHRWALFFFRKNDDVLPIIMFPKRKR
jgi:hypothetical protein